MHVSNASAADHKPVDQYHDATLRHWNLKLLPSIASFRNWQLRQPMIVRSCSPTTPPSRQPQLATQLWTAVRSRWTNLGTRSSHLLCQKLLRLELVLVSCDHYPLAQQHNSLVALRLFNFISLKRLHWPLTAMVKSH